MNKSNLKTEGYYVARDILSKPLLKIIETYFQIKESTNNVGDPDDPDYDPEKDDSGLWWDKQVMGSRTIHGDTITDSLLSYMTPIFSEIAGVSLVPTYSFFRYYNTGQELHKHSDRIACEFSITIPIAYSEIWPICLTDFKGVDKKLDLSLGDALFYKGCAIDHWRDPFEGEWSYQVFLHYIDIETAKRHPMHIFDRRELLGAQKT